ncbi:unnamed protein product, partial [Pleuronectes platessa]
RHSTGAHGRSVGAPLRRPGKIPPPPLTTSSQPNTPPPAHLSGIPAELRCGAPASDLHHRTRTTLLAEATTTHLSPTRVVGTCIETEDSSEHSKDKEGPLAN